jgi:hypothetical protein
MTLLRREAPVEVVDHDIEGRTVTVQLCRWNDPREVVDPDGKRYREQFTPDSLELAGNVHVADRHEGSLIGRALPETFDQGTDGPTVRARRRRQRRRDRHPHKVNRARFGVRVPTRPRRPDPRSTRST